MRPKEHYPDFCLSDQSGVAIALSFIAAEALVSACLNGRTLAEDLHSALIIKVRRRLIDGKVPVFDREICRAIEDGALEFAMESLGSG
jgi:hypothetical protein